MRRLGNAVRWTVAMGLVAATGLGAGNAAPPSMQEPLGAAERLVLTSFNLCWTAEENGGFERLATDAGFSRTPQARGPLYYRDAQGAVVFITADFGPGADGAPEPACRFTVVKPQLDTPFSPRQPLMPAGEALIDRIIAESKNMGSGYRVVALRQPHPGRPGRYRTLLRSDQGARARMIYIERGARDYEFLYVHGSRVVIDSPATPDIGTDPAGRIPVQAFVNDRWEIAFCNLNPHACLTPQQQRQMDQAAQARARDSTNWTLPFSGIGSSRSGDNRSNQQRLNDRAWWDNYHRCGRGKC